MHGTCIHCKHAAVSDAGIVNACRHLAPPDKQNVMMKQFAMPKTNDDPVHDLALSSCDGLENGKTGSCLFVGLKGNHESDLHSPCSQLWTHPSSSIQDDLEKIPKKLQDGLKNFKPEDLMSLFVGAPSAKDSDWNQTHPGKSSPEIITSIPWELFEKFAPDVTPLDDGGTVDLGGSPDSCKRQLKETLAAVMWVRAHQGLVHCGASKSLSNALANVSAFELGTPLTHAHCLWNDRGAFCGLSHDMCRFSPKCSFKNFDLKRKSKIHTSLDKTSQSPVLQGHCAAPVFVQVKSWTK